MNTPITSKNTVKRMAIALLVATTLTVGVVTVGAQDDAPTEPPTSETTRQRGHRGGGGDMDLLLTYTGLDQDALREALRSGSTPAALIEANGERVDTYVAASVDAATAQLDEALAAGEIDQATYDERVASVEAHVTERVNGTADRSSRDEGKGPRGERDGNGSRGQRGNNGPAGSDAPAGDA